MSINDVVQTKLNQLVGIILTNGVQPSDLVDNVFLNEYNRVLCYRQNNFIINEVSFNEITNGKTIEIILRYYYSMEKKLMRIEEYCNGETHIEWDRDIVESTLINDIVDILKIHYTDNQMQRFIDSVPENLKSLIEKAYIQVA